MKLKLATILVTFLVMGFSTSGYAKTEMETLPDSARSLPSYGEYTPQPNNSLNTLDSFSTLSSCSPLYVFKVEMVRPFLFGSDYAFATSESKENCNGTVKNKAIDLVYAKAKLYKYGDIIASKDDTTNNGYYAGAKAYNNTSSTLGLEAYGEHKFKQAGYMEHTFATYDN